jgi:hypothetical protein
VPILQHDRKNTFVVDAATSIWGLAIVRAELAATPRLGEIVGKTAWIVDADGVRSQKVGHYQGAVALEGQWGDAIDGSLELMNALYEGVPAGGNLLGVEAFTDGTATTRVVSRVAAGAALSGVFWEDRLAWKLRGEAGLSALDVLMSAEVKLRLPLGNFYVGGRSDVFAGSAGTPGWMRQDASLVGVFLGEGA